MLWLDHLIFGNGRGLGSPHWDQRFYWLSGRLYTFMPGFGAQLHSFQWTHPRAGERRRLSGRDYVVFSSTRRGLRVAVSWSLVGLPRNVTQALDVLREIESELGMFHG